MAMKSLFVFLQRIAPQQLISRLMGKLASSERFSEPAIRWFIGKYKVDMSLAQRQDPSEYRDFNDFFTRELREGVRPIPEEPTAILCPADGQISQLGSISGDQLLQAKGQHYSVAELLGDNGADAETFKDGKFMTVYLSPRDYHRVHMPFAGELRKTVYIPGKLFSVNQTTADAVPGLFARNERLVCLFDTEIGPMAIVLVGAMIVAGIETVWAGRMGSQGRTQQLKLYPEDSPPISLASGSELGRFYLGSTAIVLLPANTMTFESQLTAGTDVMMGQTIGHIDRRA